MHNRQHQLDDQGVHWLNAPSPLAELLQPCSLLLSLRWRRRHSRNAICTSCKRRRGCTTKTTNHQYSCHGSRTQSSLDSSAIGQIGWERTREPIPSEEAGDTQQAKEPPTTLGAANASPMVENSLQIKGSAPRHVIVWSICLRLEANIQTHPPALMLSKSQRWLYLEHPKRPSPPPPFHLRLNSIHSEAMASAAAAHMLQ